MKHATFVTPFSGGEAPFVEITSTNDDLNFSIGNVTVAGFDVTGSLKTNFELSYTYKAHYQAWL